MILYLDTSALVKLLVDEAGSEEVRSWTEVADDVATSVIALPEAVSAVARAYGACRLSGTEAEHVRHDLMRIWERSLHVGVDEERAAAVAWSHGLRGLDAVQLAGARTLSEAVGVDELAFCSFDRALSAAAVAEGLIVLEAS